MPQPTGVPATDASSASVACEWRVHKASLTFNGAVTVPAIQQLVRYIERAFDYYKYDTVEVEIDSPGGELRALNYFLEYRRAWQEQGYAIHTRGVVTCASAAALLLAFGDHGGRYIHSSTELLFHFSRVSLGQQVLTAARASQVTLALQRTDDSMLDALVEHIIGRDKVTRALTLAQYHATTRQRLARMLELNVFAPDEVEASLRCQQFDELARVIGQADEVGGLLQRLRAHLRSRFESEQLMGHVEAYVLNLVDHVGGFAPPMH
jgi:ATP-dependent protease ClpP protease subunit